MAYQKGAGKSVVIALGGNALGNTPQEQLALVKKTATSIVDMIDEGINVVVTHGNGPQVGMINKAFDEAHAVTPGVPEMPFPECGAMSQGYIGYQLSQAILTELKRRGIMRSTATVITQTVVYPDDPAFEHPTKPIGSFLTEEEARQLALETGWVYLEDAGRGWRRVVASPRPQRIVEFDAVKDLMDDGYIVIAAGGGGVPVIARDDSYVGVPAVVDKDRSSAKLAADLKADMLIILTAVEKVAIAFNTPNQQNLNFMSVEDAHRYINEGQFAAGSMLPKVQACLEYLDAHPSGEALITSLEQAAAGLRGETGTRVAVRRTWPDPPILSDPQ
ncbi:MAG: carbamate kinase [Eggerthellaceae bacterium]|nr:carbamate kinase [Eggerthellaceae bacterium]